MVDRKRLLWAPQAGRQAALVSCPFRYILFGGARGGGKTDGALGKLLNDQVRMGSSFNALFIRQEMTQAKDLIARARELFEPVGAKFNKSERTFTFPSGGRLTFMPIMSLDDTSKFQGSSFTHIVVEEAGNYPDPAPLDRCFGALRAPKPDIHGRPIVPQLILTANPGGAGQAWLKKRFIDPAPQGMVPIPFVVPNAKDENGQPVIIKSIFIPSKVQDNQILLKNDPNYVNALYLSGSKELVRAWLEGDWSAIDGAYFSEWRDNRHIIKSFMPPNHWMRFRSIDWGSSKPFSVGWWAVASEDFNHEGRIIPQGALVRYREWYGQEKDKHNVGLKLSSKMVAKGITDRELKSEYINYTIADPAMWNKVNGYDEPSIAEEMILAGVSMERAKNNRVSGWDQVRNRLSGNNPVREKTDQGYGVVVDPVQPMIYFCGSACKDSIRTLPVLQHCNRNAEDVDTDMEDHAPDEIRYACMSRPWAAPTPIEEPINDSYQSEDYSQSEDSWRV